MAFAPNEPRLPDVGDATFEPDQVIDNPYSPFPVGRVLSSEAFEEGEDELSERSDVFVTGTTREIQGVTATVVRDTVYDADGRLVENTDDWFAQDTDGNVWYLGELSYSFEYDEETGEFLGAEPDGSWEWGIDGALPGLSRPAASEVGDSYYQEFYPGVAEDAAQVLATDAALSIDFDDFEDVIKTFDFSTLEADAREFKYAALGLGVVLEEGLDEEDEVEEINVLTGVRDVAPTNDEVEDVLLRDLREGQAITPEEPERDELEVDADEDEGESYTVTFLGGVDELDNALGVYTYDAESGEIGEGRILFPSSERTENGAMRTVEVGAGQGLGVFLVSNAAVAGVDLAEFADGGLFFRNTGAGQPATIADEIAPAATDEDGELLPFTILHALDAEEDGVNFLNPTGGIQATELELFPDEEEDGDGEDDDEEDESEGEGEDEEDDDDDDDGLEDFAEDAQIIGFEERVITDTRSDGDFNDVLALVSEEAPSAEALAEIRGMFGSEIVAYGDETDEHFLGGHFDDLILGRGGNDRFFGLAGDDHIRAGTGDDLIRGGGGDDTLRGGAGQDTVRYAGVSDGYEVETQGQRVVVTDIDPSNGDYGTDTLYRVETIRFDEDSLIS